MFIDDTTADFTPAETVLAKHNATRQAKRNFMLRISICNPNCSHYILNLFLEVRFDGREVIRSGQPGWSSIIR